MPRGVAVMRITPSARIHDFMAIWLSGTVTTVARLGHTS